MDRRRVGVIETEREGAHLLVDHAVPVDGRGLGHRVQVRGVGHRGHDRGRLGGLGPLLGGGRGGGVGVGLLALELVIQTLDDVLDLVREQQRDGAGGDMLGVTHLHLHTFTINS